ncbi:12585_t:CDS:2 [Funneliformis geosporum]|uniref:14208_t:CDS:1 n=1 Tax=Funneliformis geosporum TaxID=1117311 RepID=A0A9W4SAV4_9GLOM|nr:14208_t:CDS:2 [Funneliformis geosporum]CAI2166290.1 12585_t:CDS:2 [Funneliformis geosporum]
MNLIRKEYRIKEDMVISNQLFETRINEIDNAIGRRAVGKGSYLFLYIFTTLLVLAIGVPVTKGKADKNEDYSYFQWAYFFIIVSCVYLVVKMKEVEKVMVRMNNLDNPKYIFWNLDFTDKYVMEGYRKKYYYVILELSSPIITQQVTAEVTVLPPPTLAPPQQIVIITGNAATSPLNDYAAQTTQTISIDASQLNQILAVAQQQQLPPLPPPKY